MHMIRICLQMLMMWCIIPSQQKFTLGILPVKSIVTFEFIIIFANMQHAVIYEHYLHFDIRAGFPTLEIDNFVCQNDGRRIK